MPEPTVATVMTRTVFIASADTSFLEIVATLTDRGLSMLPVIDTTGRPVGVVSDVDALAKLEYHCGADYIPSSPAAAPEPAGTKPSPAPPTAS